MSLQLKTDETYKKSIIMQDRIKIKQRINFLQQSLVQLSFLPHSNTNLIERPEIYKSLNHSLKMAKRLLKENYLIQNNLQACD